MPPRTLQEDFAARTSLIYSQTDILGETNKWFAATRDKLLPRLISGKLSAENLDIQFPPGMAEELNAKPTATK